jgi:hypothetical protein
MVVVVVEAIQITVQVLLVQVVVAVATILVDLAVMLAEQLLIQDKEIQAATQVQALGAVDQAVEPVVQV